MLRNTAIFVGVAVGGCVWMALLSTGAAAADPAPDVIGAVLSGERSPGSAGYTTEVATVVGDRLPQDECRVVSTSKLPGSSTWNLIQVNLNCYPSGGFSAGDNMPVAEAIRDAEEQETLEWKASAGGQKWCQQTAIEHPEWVPISGCPEWQQTADGQEWCQEAQIEHPEWCRPPEARSTPAPIHIYVDGRHKPSPNRRRSPRSAR